MLPFDQPFVQWLYLTNSFLDVPDRSFLYYEWYEQGAGESDQEFSKRKKREAPDHVKYFYIKVMANRRNVH